MANIKLHYLYRDGGNNKRYNAVIFSNPDNLSLALVEAVLKKHLIEEQWFYADLWQLEDLHFPKWDRQLDHDVHEYHDLEETDESATESRTIQDFLNTLPPPRW